MLVERLVGLSQSFSQTCLRGPAICLKEDEKVCSCLSGHDLWQVKEVRYGQHSIWIQEGLLGDGLGARIWAAAAILCR